MTRCLLDIENWRDTGYSGFVGARLSRLCYVKLGNEGRRLCNPLLSYLLIVGVGLSLTPQVPTI